MYEWDVSDILTVWVLTQDVEVGHASHQLASES